MVSYVPGRDGPLFCPLCTHKMPAHHDNCPRRSSAKIAGWTCQTINNVRVAKYDTGTESVFVTPDGFFHAQDIDRVLVLAPTLITWLFVFRSSPEDLITGAYESHWVNDV